MMKEEESYKTERIPLSFLYKGKSYEGYARPLSASCRKEVCFELDVVLNGIPMGTIYSGPGMRWTMKGTEQELAKAIGEKILLWYE